MAAEQYTVQGVRYELADEQAMLETLISLRANGFRGGVYVDDAGVWLLELNRANETITGAAGDALVRVGDGVAATIWKESGNASA